MQLEEVPCVSVVGFIHPILDRSPTLRGLNGGAHVLFYTSATITINLVSI
jgi:hypothetical protein